MSQNLPEIIHIAAVEASDHRGIGSTDGALLHRIPEDMAFFKQQTMGHAVLVGRKTWDSMATILPGRQVLVLSHNKGPGHVSSIQEAIDWCREKQFPVLYIIGGQSVYEQTMTLANRLFITWIHDESDKPVGACYPKIPHHFAMINEHPGNDPRLIFSEYIRQ